MDLKLKNSVMIECLFSLKGRIGRGEYVMAFVTSLIYLRLCSTIEILFFMMLWFIGAIFFCWFFIAQGTKRCHDLGKPGWYQFIPFYFLLLLAKRGEEHGNQYGDYFSRY